MTEKDVEGLMEALMVLNLLEGARMMEMPKRQAPVSTRPALRGATMRFTGAPNGALVAMGPSAFGPPPEHRHSRHAQLLCDDEDDLMQAVIFAGLLGLLAEEQQHEQKLQMDAAERCEKKKAEQIKFSRAAISPFWSFIHWLTFGIFRSDEDSKARKMDCSCCEVFSRDPNELRNCGLHDLDGEDTMKVVMNHILRELPPDIQDPVFDEFLKEDSLRSSEGRQCLILSIGRNTQEVEKLVKMHKDQHYLVTEKHYESAVAFLEDESVEKQYSEDRCAHGYQNRFSKIVEMGVLVKVMHHMEDHDRGKNRCKYCGQTANAVSTFWDKLRSWMREDDLSLEDSQESTSSCDSRIMSINNIDKKVAEKISDVAQHHDLEMAAHQQTRDGVSCFCWKMPARGSPIKKDL